MEVRKTFNLSIGVSPQGVGVQFDIDPKPIGEPQGPWPPGTYKCHAEVHTVTAPAQSITPKFVDSFDHWEGDEKSDSLGITINLDSDKTIVAVYTRSEPPVAEPGPPYTPPVMPPPVK